MKYYPVIIPTLCRYEHFKRCVESLAKNTHAEKTELVIGLDYPPKEKYREGYDKIKSYVASINGFRKVTVFYHKENIGAVRNWAVCRDYCFEHYSAYIGTEDDNEFSPCFLDFMNKALSKYEYDDSIESIGGWTPEYMYNDDFDCYLDYSSTGWGVGRWKRKEIVYYPLLNGKEFIVKSLLNKSIVLEMLRDCPRRLNNNINLVNKNEDWGDVKRGMIMQVYGLSQLRPCLSLVRNYGNDGSGLHCKNDDNFSKQIISTDSLYDSDWSVADKNYYKFIAYKKTDMPDNFFVRIAFYGIIVLKYTMFRLKYLV